MSSDSVQLRALFSRVSRKAEKVLAPLNESALDEQSLAPKLYLVHSIAGASSDFLHIAAALEPDVRVFGLQAPSKRYEDPSFSGSIESIAGCYVAALVTHQPTGPIMLGGWSVGAIIAFEMAQQLRARHRTVALLVAIDDAPRNTGAGLPRWHPLYCLQVARNFPGWLSNELPPGRGLGRWAGFAKTAAATLAKRMRKSAGGTGSGDWHPVNMFIKTKRYPPAQITFMQTLYAAGESYRPRPYAGAVQVYAAKVQPLLFMRQLKRHWAKLAVRVEVQAFNATHLSIVTPPHAAPIAADLRRRITEALAVAAH